MSTPVNVIVVEGKTIAHSAELPQSASGAPVRIKAVKGAKYLFTAGKDGAVNDHIIVKRSGKNLQVFLNENDDQPELIIEDYYGNQGELAGMGNDGQYHTFVTEGTDSQAFMMIDDGAATPLLMSSSATSGLSGLTLAPAAAGGMSMGWMIAGAIGGLLALGGIAAAAGGGGGGGGGGKEPAPAPAPVNMDDLAIMDRVGSKTGPVTAGGVTDDARPLFSGTGTPGSTVRIYDNGQLIGSVAIGNDGRWQWQPEANLAAGAHDLSFAEMNRDGVEGGRSPSIGFELDLTAPARVTGLTLTDDVGYTQGPVNPGDTTNDTTPTFAGRAEAGSTVEIRDNGVLIGTAIVGADGSWSFTPSPALANGEHDFSLVVTDPAGNKGLPVNYGPVIIDDTLIDKPEFGFVNDGNDNPLQAGDAVNTNPVKLGGSGQPGDVLTIVRNGQPDGSVVVGENGEWRYDLTIPENEQGAQDVSLIITSPAGEERGRSDDFSFEFDTVAPSTPDISDVSVTDDSGNALADDDVTNTRDLTFSGSGEPGDTVYLWDGDEKIGSAVIDENGRWSIPVSDLSEGPHAFRTELQDPAGNLSGKSDSFDLVADFTAPAQNLVDVTDANGNSLASGDALNNGDLTFSGTGAEGDVVYLWDGENLVGSTVIDGSGAWSIPATMDEERQYDFSTEVKDPAGNSSGKSEAVEFTFDTTAPDQPAAPLLKMQDGSDLSGSVINQSDITLSGQTEAGATVIIYDGSNPIGSAIADANGAWSFDYTLTDEREYDFSSESVDSAGNVSSRSHGSTVSYDATAPDEVSIGGVEKADGDAITDGDYSNDNNPAFRGTGTHGDIVYLVDDATNQVLGSALVDENGEWAITPDAAFDDGALTLRADVADPAGNLTEGSSSFDFTVDTKAPDAPQNVVLEDNSPTLSGAAGSAEAGSLLFILIDGTETGSTLANSDGSWTWTGDSSMADGIYEFSVIAVDQAGNHSETSASVSYEVSTKLWDLNDGQQGWSASPNYESDIGYTDWKNGRFNAATYAGQTDKFAGEVIYQVVNVVAGQTYKFSFEAIATSSMSPARLGIEIDGNFISDNYTTLELSFKTLNGEFTATSSGPIRIAIVNENNTFSGNDFSIDNLSLRASGSGLGINDGIMSALVDEFSLQGYSLLLNDDIGVLDLSAVTGEIHEVSLAGHGNNTLNLSLGDVLSLGNDDLFLDDGAAQMMITGDAGDVVNLSDLLPDGSDAGDWNNAGDITVGGVTYQVYQHSGLDADLLVQNNVTVNLDNH